MSATHRDRCARVSSPAVTLAGHPALPAFVLGCLFAVAGVARADCPVIDFSEYAVNAAITTQYPGVTFSVQGLPGSCGVSFARIQTPAEGCSSPTRALIVDGGSIGSPSCEFHPQWLRMVFDPPVDVVRFTVGPGNAEYFQDYDIRAYNTNSGALGQVDSVSVTDAGPGVFRMVELTSAAGDIRRVEIKGMAGASLAGIEAIDDLQIGEDTTAPTAAIASPDAMECVCSGVAISGTADDADGEVATWRLERKAIDAAAWTLIRVSSSPVVDGLLANWIPAAGAPAGYYLLRLTVTNACGLSSTAVAVVYLDRAAPTLELRSPAAGAVVGGTVCLDGTASDHCGGSLDVEYQPAAGGAFAPVTSVSPPWVVNDPYATWNTRGGVADGGYTLRTTAEDGCGNVSTLARAVIVDNTPPIAIITAPLACDFVEGVVAVRGTVSDAHMAGWVLEWTGGGNAGWTTIAAGAGSIVGGVLGLWDVSELPHCAYSLRLRASDTAVLDCNAALHNSAERLVSVNVGALGDMNCDGVTDNADIDAFVHCLLTGDCGCP